MPWAVAAAAVAAGGAIYAANKQSSAAKSAANASKSATDQSIAEQQREFDQQQQNLAPWLKTGTAALGQLSAMEGLGGKPADYSAFYNSPDYQFALQQGQQALDRSAAARGSLYSGGHEADTMQFGQGLASQQFGNYWNRLAGLAQIGQTTGTQLGNSGMQMAGNIGNLLMGNAQNQMGSIYNQANASSNEVSQLSGIAGNLFGNFYHPQQTASYGGNFGNSFGGNAWDTGGSGITAGNYLDSGTYAGMT